MDKRKRAQLETKGWSVAAIQEFLELTPEEMAYIDLKLHLARQIKELRQEKRITQVALANLMGSSQSRVAKMEAGDPTVSIGLRVRSLLMLGASPKELGLIIGSSSLVTAT